MPEKDNKRPRGFELFRETIIPIALSLLGALIGTLDFVQSLTAWPRIHWTLWIAIPLGLYLIACCFAELRHRDNKSLSKVFRVPLWTDLRSFCEQPAARVSYWALPLIPILAFCLRHGTVQQMFPGLNLPLSFKLGYFAAWFIAASLIIFGVACPKALRRRNALEKVKTVNIVMNNVEKPQVIVEPDEPPDDPALDRSSPALRWICYSFYTFGTVTAIVILVRGALFVLEV